MRNRIKIICEGWVEYLRDKVCDRFLSTIFRSKPATAAAVALIVIVATLITSFTFQRMPVDAAEGGIADRDFKADRNYNILDEENTSKLKEDAVGEVQVVYDYDPFLAEKIRQRLSDCFNEIRARYWGDHGRTVQNPRDRAVVDLKDSDYAELDRILSDRLEIVLSEGQLKNLARMKFGYRIEESIGMLVEKTLARPIVTDRNLLDAQKGAGIIIKRRIDREGAKTEEYLLEDLKNIISVDDAKNSIGSYLPPSSGDREIDKTIVAIATLLVESNCSFNREETRRRMDTEAASVENVIIKVRAGEMIFRDGDAYTRRHIKILQGIEKEKMLGAYLYKFIGTSLLMSLFVASFYMLRGLFRRLKLDYCDYVLISIMAILGLLMARIAFALVPAVIDAFMLSAPALMLYYAIPVAASAMIIRMYLGAEITFAFSVIFALSLGSFNEVDLDLCIFYLVTSFTAILAIAHVDKRSSILRAGAITGAVASLAALAIEITGAASIIDPIGFKEIVWSMIYAFIGGIGASILTMIVAPLIEGISGYTSDIKLLELANLNHPLLRELIVRAPGTYHHSHLVGILGEAAAEAIGANSLLVRVGAYYHDIGKMKKPFYFVENARSGEDRHERLSPNMSALIVAAHVKDGGDMAKAAGIPQVISDMIPQHHGTRLISFFYEKAKGLLNEGDRVDAREFSYPGPKPRSREAAILMLADVTEASVRSLKEKSPNRIQQTVERVINDIFAESQLDECDITLKDLHEIAKAYVRILLGIYHQRIEYPKGSDEENDRGEISIIGEDSVSEVEARKSAEGGSAESSKPRPSSVSIRQ